MGPTPGVAALAALLGVVVQAVTLPCESMGGGPSPDIKCEMRPTNCYPGFRKVCPHRRAWVVGPVLTSSVRCVLQTAILDLERSALTREQDVRLARLSSAERMLGQQ